MGYNLYLHCATCDTTGFVSRGKEAACIRRWARLHAGHRNDVAIDNGFAEKWFVDSETAHLDEDWLESTRVPV